MSKHNLVSILTQITKDKHEDATIGTIEFRKALLHGNPASNSYILYEYLKMSPKMKEIHIFLDNLDKVSEERSVQILYFTPAYLFLTSLLQAPIREDILTKDEINQFNISLYALTHSLLTNQIDHILTFLRMPDHHGKEITMKKTTILFLAAMVKYARQQIFDLLSVQWHILLPAPQKYADEVLILGLAFLKSFAKIEITQQVLHVQNLFKLYHVSGTLIPTILQVFQEYVANNTQLKRREKKSFFSKHEIFPVMLNWLQNLDLKHLHVQVFNFLNGLVENEVFRLSTPTISTPPNQLPNRRLAGYLADVTTTRSKMLQRVIVLTLHGNPELIPSYVMSFKYLPRQTDILEIIEQVLKVPLITLEPEDLKVSNNSLIIECLFPAVHLIGQIINPTLVASFWCLMFRRFESFMVRLNQIINAETKIKNKTSYEKFKEKFLMDVARTIPITWSSLCRDLEQNVTNPNLVNDILLMMMQFMKYFPKSMDSEASKTLIQSGSLAYNIKYIRVLMGIIKMEEWITKGYFENVAREGIWNDKICALGSEILVKSGIVETIFEAHVWLNMLDHQCIKFLMKIAQNAQGKKLLTVALAEKRDKFEESYLTRVQFHLEENIFVKTKFTKNVSGTIKHIPKCNPDVLLSTICSLDKEIPVKELVAKCKDLSSRKPAILYLTTYSNLTITAPELLKILPFHLLYAQMVKQGNYSYKLSDTIKDIKAFEICSCLHLVQKSLKSIEDNSQKVEILKQLLNHTEKIEEKMFLPSLFDTFINDKRSTFVILEFFDKLPDSVRDQIVARVINSIETKRQNFEYLEKLVFMLLPRLSISQNQTLITSIMSKCDTKLYFESVFTETLFETLNATHLTKMLKSKIFTPFLAKYFLQVFLGKISSQNFDKNRFEYITFETFDDFVQQGTLDSLQIAFLSILNRKDLAQHFLKNHKVHQHESLFASLSTSLLYNQSDVTFDVDDLVKKSMKILTKDKCSSMSWMTLNALLALPSSNIHDKTFKQVFEKETMIESEFWLIKLCIQRLDHKVNKYKRKFLEKCLEQFKVESTQVSYSNTLLKEILYLFQDEALKSHLKDCPIQEFVAKCLDECENPLLFRILNCVVDHIDNHEEVILRVFENLVPILDMITKFDTLQKTQDIKPLDDILDKLQQNDGLILSKVEEVVSQDEIFKLIHFLLDKTNNTKIIKPDFLKSLMKQYNGTMSSKDLILYDIFGLFEIKFDLHLYQFDYNFGTIEHSFISDLVKWKSVESLQYEIEFTCNHFPSDLKLFGTDTEKPNAKCIDPRFFLRWITFLCVSTKKMNWFFETSSFSLVLICLSSSDPDIRTLAYNILARIYYLVIFDNGHDYPNNTKQTHRLFLMVLKNSISEPNQRIPSAWTALFFQIVPILRKPDSPLFMHVFKFIFDRTKFNWKDFPIMSKNIENALYITVERPSFYPQFLQNSMKTISEIEDGYKLGITRDLMKTYHYIHSRQKDPILRVFLKIGTIHPNIFEKLIVNDFYLSWFVNVFKWAREDDVAIEILQILYSGQLKGVNNELKIAAMGFKEILCDKNLLEKANVAVLGLLKCVKTIQVNQEEMNQILKFEKVEMMVKMLNYVTISNADLLNTCLQNVLKRTSGNGILTNQVVKWVRKNDVSSLNETSLTLLSNLSEQYPFVVKLDQIFKKRKRSIQDDQGKDKKH